MVHLFEILSRVTLKLGFSVKYVFPFVQPERVDSLPPIHKTSPFSVNVGADTTLHFVLRSVTIDFRYLSKVYSRPEDPWPKSQDAPQYNESYGRSRLMFLRTNASGPNGANSSAESLYKSFPSRTRKTEKNPLVNGDWSLSTSTFLPFFTISTL